MSVVMAVLAGAAITAPHLLRLERAYPATAATIWLSAIYLRALVVLFAAVYVIFYLPATELFTLVTHWCWDTLAVLSGPLGVDGHRVGDAALLAPLLGISASLAWVCFGLWRAGRALSRWIRRTTIGPGPQRSVIVGEHDILVAAAGLRRPRVIVSAGALTTFDDDELAASVAHEHGHIARFHRVALLTAEISRALARFLPGTRQAIDELVFQLERDADHWALQQRHDPAALASAICKAASPRMQTRTALLTLGGGGVVQRVNQLLVPSHRLPARRARLNLLATGMAVLVAALAAALPVASVAGAAQNSHSTHTPTEHHCGHNTSEMPFPGHERMSFGLGASGDQAALRRGFSERVASANGDRGSQPPAIARENRVSRGRSGPCGPAAADLRRAAGLDSQRALRALTPADDPLEVVTYLSAARIRCAAASLKARSCCSSRFTASRSSPMLIPGWPG